MPNSRSSSGSGAGGGSTPSSGGNDTITLDGGPFLGTTVVPFEGSDALSVTVVGVPGRSDVITASSGSVDDFTPVAIGGVSNPIDGGNDTITIGSTFGSNDALSVTVGDDGIREAPLIIVDRPIDLGGGPLPPPASDPDDDLELGTVEVSLPPGPPALPGVDAPPAVLDNGLTMIAQSAPAAAGDDAAAIIAATA